MNQTKTQEEISQLKNELREREKSLPAHSIRPHQLLILEELEERIRLLEKELDTLMAETQGSTS